MIPAVVSSAGSDIIEYVSDRHIGDIGVSLLARPHERSAASSAHATNSLSPMARGHTSDRIPSLVEAQAASCRTLAQAIRNHAESLPLWRSSERRLLRGWAALVDDISFALIDSINPEAENPGLLRRVWSQSKFAAAGLGFVAGGVAGGTFEAVGQDIYEGILNNAPLIATQHEIVERAEREAPLVLSWQGPGAAAVQPDQQNDQVNATATGALQATTSKVFGSEDGSSRITLEVLGGFTLGGVKVDIGRSSAEDIRAVVTSTELSEVTVRSETRWKGGRTR